MQEINDFCMTGIRILTFNGPNVHSSYKISMIVSSLISFPLKKPKSSINSNREIVTVFPIKTKKREKHAKKDGKYSTKKK